MKLPIITVDCPLCSNHTIRFTLKSYGTALYVELADIACGCPLSEDLEERLGIEALEQAGTLGTIGTT